MSNYKYNKNINMSIILNLLILLLIISIIYINYLMVKYSLLKLNQALSRKKIIPL